MCRFILDRKMKVNFSRNRIKETGELGKNMCIIEELGYSTQNRDQHCTECVIFNQIGQCAYLKQCEVKMKTTANYNSVNIVDSKLNTEKILPSVELTRTI